MEFHPFVLGRNVVGVFAHATERDRSGFGGVCDNKTTNDNNNNNNNSNNNNSTDNGSDNGTRSNYHYMYTVFVCTFVQ